VSSAVPCYYPHVTGAGAVSQTIDALPPVSDMDSAALLEVKTSITGNSTRIVAGKNGGTLIPFTSESSKRALAHRWSGAAAVVKAAQRAGRRGMVAAGAQIPEVKRPRSSLAVLEYLTEVHTLNAADPSARNSVASFNAVMGIAYPELRERTDNGALASGGMGEDMDELLAAWRAAKAANPALAERARRLLAARLRE